MNKKTLTRNYPGIQFSLTGFVFMVLMLFRVNSGFAFVNTLNNINQQQDNTISGTVIDASTGEALIGVTVIVVGTTTGTSTDPEGKYTIIVPDGATELQFTYVGYLKQTVKINGRTGIDVALKIDAEKIGEVVVIGYGSQKKESVIGAISTLSGKEVVKTPVSNITQAIAGKIPGLITNQSHGLPGYDEAEIYIRGRGTFTGASSPLILVDGIERSFSRIDPNDIESISVLKDASATAVYGVRGANGVILITTKRGKEGKPVVSFTANTGFQKPTRLPRYLDSYNSVLLLEEALANDGLSSMYSAGDIAMFKQSVDGNLSGTDQLYYPNIDWYEEMLRGYAPETQMSVSIAGGTRRMRYFTSGTYFDQQGLYKHTNDYDFGNSANVRFRRYSFRLNIDFDATRDFTVSVNFGTRFEVRNGPSMWQEDLFHQMNHTPGWMFPVEWGDGMYGGNAANQRNIKAWLQRGGFEIDNRVINENSFVFDHKLDFVTPGLSAKGMFTFDNLFTFKRIFTREFRTYEYVAATDTFITYGEDTPLELTTENDDNEKTYHIELSLNYARSFGDHNMTGLILYNQNNFTYRNWIPFLYQGIVGRVTYNYRNTYFSEFNFGYNGSENFAEGHRFGFFPSFSVGWMLSNESFMDKLSFISKLKLRGSYGEVGNDRTHTDRKKSDRFLYLTTYYQTGGYILGLNQFAGRVEGVLANEDVTWERAKKYNFAVESGMFNDKLDVNLDLFYEKRDNILTDRLSVPSILADSLPKENLGKTKNQGFEFEMKHRSKIGKFEYYAGVIYCMAKNEVLFRDEPVGKPEYQLYKGHPIKQYYGLVVDKYFESEEEIANSPVQAFGPVSVGDFKYVDQNGDNIIDERDIAAVGFSDIPEQTYSLDLGASYAGFDISVLFQGVRNVSKIYDAEAILEFLNGGKVMEHHLDRWNPNLSVEENKANAEYPLLHVKTGGNNHRANSFFIKNGNFLRLKSFELAYTIPKNISQKLTTQSIRLYMNASNLFTWDHIKIRDPENSGNGKAYPVMSFYNFGINVQF